MPYLTLWDKISQNLAYLEANSHKIFQVSQKFQTILQHILDLARQSNGMISPVLW